MQTILPGATMLVHVDSYVKYSDFAKNCQPFLIAVLLPKRVIIKTAVN